VRRQRSARPRGDLDARRRLLREGRERQGGGAVRKSTGGEAGRRGSQARARQGLLQQGRRRQGARVVSAGHRVGARHARSGAGGGIHQGAQETAGRFPGGVDISRALSLLAAALVWIHAAVLFAQEKGGENEAGSYELVANWLQPVCG